jgi:hypothetical protein
MDQDILPGSIMPKTNDAALAAFIARKAEIDAMLERLAALSADHFECSPEDGNGGDVGTLEHYRARLREFTDMAFRGGEQSVSASLCSRKNALQPPTRFACITPPPWRYRPAARRRW